MVARTEQHRLGKSDEFWRIPDIEELDMGNGYRLRMIVLLSDLTNFYSTF